MMKRPQYHKRAFLNKTHGTAFIEAVVRRHKGSTYIDASVKIADCSHNITLDFDVSNEGGDLKRSLKNRLQKIDVMISVLQGVRDTLEVESEKAAIVAAEYKAKGKKYSVLDEILEEEDE